MKITDLGVTFKFLPFKCYSSASRNFQPRLLQPDGIGIHYISCKNVAPGRPFNTELTWQLLHDLNFEPDDRLYNIYHGKKSYASYHLLVGRDAESFQLVPFEYQAYHAGVSEFAGRKFCNKFMIGLAFVGSYETGPTQDQYEMLAKICAFLITEYDIQKDMIAGHEDIAPGRKKDPHGHGDDATFSWPKLHGLIALELNRSE